MIRRKHIPDVQIITIDPAKLNYDNFSECIIEVWRNGKKLIPEKLVCVY